MTERTWHIPEERKPLTRKQRAELFLRQDGRCPNCGQRLEVKGGRPVATDEHLEPLWRLGSNDLINRELWCIPCTRPKTKQEAVERGKCNRVRDKHIGAIDRRGSFSHRGATSNLRKKLNGDIVDKYTGEIIRKGRQ